MPPRSIAVPLLAAFAITACSGPPDNLLRVSGYVEATEVAVAAETAGRIVDVHVMEGDRVAAGDVIAQLETRDAELQAERLRAERASADAQLRLLQAGARPEDIRQAEAQVGAAEADVEAIAAEVRAAELDLDRFESLLAANAGSRKQRDDARARLDAARERQRGAAARVQASRETLARLRSGARREEIDVARARIAAVDAEIHALDETIQDARVTAPVGGIVTQTLMDEGELAARGVPLVVVTDLDAAWANLFVPEPAVPRIAIGQSAIVRTDAGGEGLTGTVTYISPRAEFTPRNVQTAEERSKLVYRIKVAVDNRGGILKQGMPVDAELQLQ